ncbi:MAG TPA: sensor domain-containing diguanylate cyclase [Wenzhouxiangellaceae bacterium]|nr:sensor domain-containing diguanylate cyclase [Wenzhouxiangellaceae bacterium]
MTTLKEFSDFDSAAFAVLQFLHQRYGFGLWMITRVKEESWVVLSAEDQSFGVKAGDTFEWSDSICSRMVRDEGPRVAGRCDEIPAYVDAPIRSRFDINAYIGIPLQTSCGRFFGTLCAIDNVEHPELDDSELPLLELLSGLLAGYVRNELENNELERRNERFRFEAMTDALTHLPNRRAWEEKLGKEQQRSRRLGETTFISIIDLNELKEINDRKGHAEGDELLRKTALALRYAVRNSDFLARVGGDEFAVLGIQCDSIEPDDVSDRLRASLQSVDISASVGTAVGRSSDTHCEVWHNADAAMYRDKKSDGRVGCR